MFKYLPTPSQLRRWKNETTFLLTFAMGAIETLRDYFENSDPSDPLMWLKGLAIVLVGLVQRWRSYGKETIEVDLPAMEIENEIDWPPDPFVSVDWTANHSSERRGFRDLLPSRAPVEADV